MVSSFATRFSVAADVEAMWHHLGAKICGAELGEKIGLQINISKTAS
jgi:hypothetical protein